MHPRTLAKTKEITKTILEIAASGLMTWALLGSPKNLGRYGKILGSMDSFARWRIRGALKKLKMQNMILYSEKDMKSPIRLTTKGMIRLARYKFINFFKKAKKWDYFWRMVVFDISEKKRRLRRRLRRDLIGIGFYPLQESVLVCPFDCEEMIADLCKMYGVSGCVVFCITPSLGAKEEEAREYFFTREKS